MHVPMKQFTGFWVDAVIAVRDDLTAATKLVLGLVAAMVRLYGACEATTGYIASCLNLDRSTVDKALAALDAAGLIERRTTRTPQRTKRVIRLGAAYPEKPAPLPEKAADVPENPWSLDTTVRSIKGDKDGVALGLPRLPFENGTAGTRRELQAPGPSLPQEPSALSRGRLIREWSAQTVACILGDGASRPNQKAKDMPSSAHPINPASDRTANDPVFMKKSLDAYPGSEDPMVFRQHMRRAASTRILRSALAANVVKGYARARFGVDELGVDALTMAGTSRKMPRLCQGLYDRPAPDSVSEEVLAAVTDAEVAAVMAFLDQAKWGAACWLPCLREIAARVRLYGVALDVYFNCADAVRKRYPEAPFLWIADSVTGAEIEVHVAGVKQEET